MRGVPKTHPRAESLKIRERLADGFKFGLVVPEGLTAHGRGEAFDYILGERTNKFAHHAIEAAVAKMLLARHPVISVNGNVATLVPAEIVMLAKLVKAKIEVNLFHGSKERETAIANHLRKHGGEEIFGLYNRFSTWIPEVNSNRRKIDRRGILASDVVLIPLEDGDRAYALKRLGKRTIAIDLNPMSRTAMAADITIVDNITRSLPLMVETAEALSTKSRKELRQILEKFDNDANLKASLGFMLERLENLSGE
jgi:4-phosphopantoate--beta-alanine ligase